MTIKTLTISAVTALALTATGALAAVAEGPKEDVDFSFEGPFGAYDEMQLQRGLQIYTEVCSACHGPTGDGNIAMGAPRLNDDIWLYGGDAGSIMQTLTKGRSGKMPRHAEMLSEAKIHLLSSYVYQLSRQEP